jgi:hypothetical protein
MSIRVIPFNSLLKVLESNSEPFPFLESFARKYSQKVSEDRKTPLFSKTQKYNSFPVRCHWKGENKKKSNKTRTKNGEKRNLPDGTLCDNKDSTWRKEKINTTVLKKVSGIKSFVIRTLNKITENNFESQANILLNELLENKDSSAVKTVAEIILDKVWYDKSFYNIYVALCQKLWKNTSWMTPAYKIFKTNNNNKIQYFYTLQIESNNKTNSLIGPYKTQEQTETEALKKVHLKSIFLALCRDHFHKREQYINDARNMSDNGNDKYKTKRKLYGTVEILGQFYKMGYLDEKIIHFIFLSLLHSNTNDKEKGAKYEEEIEAFHLLWNIVKDKIPINIFREYRPLLEKEYKSNKWPQRINFMIDDIIEFTNYKFIGKSFESKKFKPEFESKQRELCDEDLENLVKENRKTNINDKLKNIKIDKLVILLIQDIMEYGEYLDNHVETLKCILKSGYTHKQLTEAISLATEDIIDIKIDAPKAPHNIAKLLTILLQNCNININIKPNEFYTQDEQKEEWNNIIKLSNLSNINLTFN